MKEKKNKKLNCWEFKQCGREKGGAREKELGVCPATISGKGDGFNGGLVRGRVCWAVAGTFCEGTVEGSFAKDYRTCLECDFYASVLEEEGVFFDLLLPLSDKEIF